jgi:hypothetical protein
MYLNRIYNSLKTVDQVRTIVIIVVSEPRFGSETQVSHRYTGAYGSLGVPRGA